MSYAARSVIHNPRPSTINKFVNWQAEGVSIKRDQSLGKLVFELPRGSRMTQRVEPVRFHAVTPEDFLVKLSYKTDIVSQVYSLQSRVVVDVNYTTGRIDSYVFNVASRQKGVTDVADQLIMPDPEGVGDIAFIDITISNENVNPLRIISIEMFNSVATLDSEENQRVDTDKQILYGLEADMPILR